MPRLLVIDDEPNLQYSLVKSLQSESLEVTTAATARQGIDAVKCSLRTPSFSMFDCRTCRVLMRSTRFGESTPVYP